MVFRNCHAAKNWQDVKQERSIREITLVGGSKVTEPPNAAKNQTHVTM